MNSHTPAAPARRRRIRLALVAGALVVAGGATATTLPAIAGTTPTAAAGVTAASGVTANLALRNDQILLLLQDWSLLTIDVANRGPDAISAGDGPAFTATFTYPIGWSVDGCAPISDTQCRKDGPASLASGSTFGLEGSITAPARSVGGLSLDITARPGVADPTSDHSNHKEWVVTFLQF